MSRIRAQSIVIQDERVLFGFGKGVHFFPGGRLEEGETPEHAALRELREEANVEGAILFPISEPSNPTALASACDAHFTFLVDIQDQSPRLGYDPEKTDTRDQISLVGIDMIPLDRTGSFTEIDINYFTALVTECSKRNLDFPWLRKMNSLIARWSQK